MFTCQNPQQKSRIATIYAMDFATVLAQLMGTIGILVT